MDYQPDINSCLAQIMGTPSGTTLVVASATECTAIGLTPQPNWVGLNAFAGSNSAGSLALTQIQVTWEVDYNNPIVMPGQSNANFILNAPVPIGVTSSSYTVSFPGSGKFTLRFDASRDCSYSSSWGRSNHGRDCPGAR